MKNVNQFFSTAIVALVLVFAFSSCQKEDLATTSTTEVSTTALVKLDISTASGLSLTFTGPAQHSAYETVEKGVIIDPHDELATLIKVVDSFGPRGDVQAALSSTSLSFKSITNANGNGDFGHIPVDSYILGVAVNGNGVAIQNITQEGNVLLVTLD